MADDDEAGTSVSYRLAVLTPDTSADEWLCMSSKFSSLKMGEVDVTLGGLVAISKLELVEVKQHLVMSPELVAAMGSVAPPG